MKKSEIKNLKDNELIAEYVRTFAHYDSNYVLRRGVNQLAKHLKDLEEELLQRNILTQEDVDKLITMRLKREVEAIIFIATVS